MDRSRGTRVIPVDDSGDLPLHVGGLVFLYPVVKLRATVTRDEAQSRYSDVTLDVEFGGTSATAVARLTGCRRNELLRQVGAGPVWILGRLQEPDRLWIVDFGRRRRF